jgi:hypothetical protein
MGTFILSSTVGVTKVCDVDSGQVYDLSYMEGITYAFIPDDFDFTYTVRGINEYSFKKGSGFMCMGTTMMNGTGNLVGSDADVGDFFIVPSTVTNDGGGTTDWLSKKSGDFNVQTDDPGGFLGFGGQPDISFYLCRRSIDSKGKSITAGECVLSEVPCNELLDTTKLKPSIRNDGTYAYSEYGIASSTPAFSSVFSYKYRLTYYQGKEGTELSYEVANVGDNVDTGIFRCNDPGIFLDRCRLNSNLSIAYDLSSGSDNLAAGGNKHFSSTPPVFISDQYYDFNFTFGGNKTSGRVYNVARQPLKAASTSSGGLFGTTTQRTLFRAEEVHI